MNRAPAIVVAVVVALLILVAYSSLFVVTQYQQALVLQFGQYKRSVVDPGLHTKIPLIENVVYLDHRILSAEPSREQVNAADQKRLVVDSYARYRINDPLAFYRSVGSEEGARIRLESIISSSVRDVLGNVVLASVLSPERAAIMQRVTSEVARQAKSFGIEVVDVRMRRADLPDANSQAIYQRMISERQREAGEFRAEGDEAAQRITATADREKTVIIAEAQRQAQILRGEGEGETVKIYADAFGKDKDFFAFYRSMEAYRDALAGHSTSLVLSPDSEFFRYFGNASGALPGTAAAPRPVQGGEPTKP